MKSKFLYLSLIFSLALNVSWGQCTILGTAVPGYPIRLQSPPNPTQMCVEYNPIKDIYYTTNGGWVTAPVLAFDNTGAPLTSVTGDFDYRGGWWNYNTNQLQGNGFSTAGAGYQNLVAGTGWPVASAFTTLFGLVNPTSQQMASYDDVNNYIIMYNSGTIIKYNGTTGALVTTVTITGLPVGIGNLNQYTSFYVGCPGLEYGVYDYVLDRFYFISATGAYAGTSQIPAGSPKPSFYSASYSNGMLWLGDNSTYFYSYYVIQPCYGGVIHGDTAVCVGSTITLSDTTGLSSGTWSSGMPLIATVNAATGAVTGVSAGTTVITYTVTLACGVATAIDTITVKPLPPAITGIMSICPGSSIPLSDATAGGTWSSSNPTIASIGAATGILDGVNPGICTIIYTSPTTRCAITAPVTVLGPLGPDSVCIGSTVTLVSPGTGIWTSSDTAIATIDAFGVATGKTIGTSIISYASGFCPQRLVLTVNPIAPLLGADSVCVAGTAYFTDIVGVGSWSSSKIAVATVAPATGLVTGVSAGTSTISFTSREGCLATAPVRIIALPSPVTGVMHLCPGTAVTLADTTAGGTWSSANTNVATVSAGGVVTGVIADTTSILYTIKPECSIRATVLVNPLPQPITGKDPICPGITDTLHDENSGGLWSSSTPSVDTIIDTNGVMTTRLSGPAIISYTLPTGCSISKTFTVFATASPVITYNDSTNTFYAPEGFPHYQWYDSISGKIPLANSPSLAGIYTQWYYVVVTDTNGCLASSAIYHFNLNILDVQNSAKAGIRIFPNPMDGIVYIDAPVSARAVLTTIDGKKIMDKSDAKNLDVSKLPPGMYMISLYDDSGNLLTVQKMIKE